MKKNILSIAVTALISFIGYNTINKADAKATQVEGVYVFIDCKPINKYTVIGEIQLSVVNSSHAHHAEGRDKLIQRCKKRYPTAEGIVIAADQVYMNAEVIDFVD